jgi:hypothetical protein
MSQSSAGVKRSVSAVEPPVQEPPAKRATEFTPEFGPDIFDDATHKELDKDVMSVFDEDPSRHPYVAFVLLAAIVSKARGRLNQRYSSNDNAKLLLEENPWLMDMLCDGWKNRGYKSVRNLSASAAF